MTAPMTPEHDIRNQFVVHELRVDGAVVDQSAQWSPLRVDVTHNLVDDMFWIRWSDPNSSAEIHTTRKQLRKLHRLIGTALGDGSDE